MSTQELLQVHKTDTQQQGDNPGHTAELCKFKTAKCCQCGKLGHIQHVCRSKPVSKFLLPVRSVHEEEEYSILKVHRGNDRAPQIMIEIDINGQVLELKLDTRAAYLMVSEKTYHDHWPNAALTPSQIRLCSYSGERIEVVGSLDACVQYKQKQAKLQLLVVTGSSPSLLGRNWLRSLKLDWRETHYLQNTP